MRKITVRQFYSKLDDFSKKLIDQYIETDYVPKVRTGLGKKNNFFYEHNSDKGIGIIREIIKFKKIQLNSGYLSFTSKKKINFVTSLKEKRFNNKKTNKDEKSKNEKTGPRRKKRPNR